MARVRVSRVGEQIKKELSQILQFEVKDPRIGFVTVTSVEMSGDLQHARVYVSVLGSEEEKEQTLAALEKAKGFIRTEIGRRVKLRLVPEIVFELDESHEHAERINRLLSSIQERDNEENI